jgi:hypothetical protein
MAELEFVRRLLGLLIGLAVAVSLFPVIQIVIAEANITGPATYMIGLIPTIIGLTIALYAFRELLAVVAG